MKKEDFQQVQSVLLAISAACRISGKMFESLEKDDIEIEFFNDNIEKFGELLIAEGKFFKSIVEKESQAKN